MPVCARHFIAFTAALAATLSISAPAAAGCREEVQAMMKAAEEAENYVIRTELLMGGNVVQTTEQRYRDYSHFYQHVKETGVHWLVLANQEYTSGDGQSFTPTRTRSDTWLEETLARNATLREAIRDTACSTEEMDGTTVTRFEHTQETKEPMESVSRVITWVDPATGRIARRHMTTSAGGQEMEIRTGYEWPGEVVLPNP